jgi:uncharacterized membrane protein
MKSRKWTSVVVMTLFAALAMAVSLGMTAVPVNAQQRSIHRTDLSTWTGGNRMSQTSQAPPQTPNGNNETKNHDVRYNVVPIGVLPGKTTSFLTVVRGVNNIGHVTGYSYVYTGDIFLTGQGFIWQNGKLKALPLLSGWPGAFGFGMNDRDQVVGTANNMDGSGNYLQTAVLWNHGQPVNLGALQPNWNSVALDVNISGVVVGGSTPVGASTNTPVVWYGGMIHPLPLLPGEDHGIAEEINALGVIVGRQGPPDQSSQIPCLWYWNGTGYTALNLGSLGGDYGDASGINIWGQAVGWSLYAGNIHGPGFLWDYRHGMQALPLLPGDTDASIFNINDFSQSVGESQVFDNNGNFVSQRAAIWENGTVTDLQTLVPPGTPPLTYETGNINDLGEITVNATNPDGSPDALLLVPTH